MMIIIVSIINYFALRTALFGAITLYVVVIPYRNFGSVYISHEVKGNKGQNTTGVANKPVVFWPILSFTSVLHTQRGCLNLRLSFPSLSWPLKIGPIGCPETSVRHYHYWLRNSPEERSSLLLRGGAGNHAFSYVIYIKFVLEDFVAPRASILLHFILQVSIRIVQIRKKLFVPNASAFFMC